MRGVLEFSIGFSLLQVDIHNFDIHNFFNYCRDQSVRTSICVLKYLCKFVFLYLFQYVIMF